MKKHGLYFLVLLLAATITVAAEPGVAQAKAPKSKKSQAKKTKSKNVKPKKAKKAVKMFNIAEYSTLPENLILSTEVTEALFEKMDEQSMSEATYCTDCSEQVPLQAENDLQLNIPMRNENPIKRLESTFKELGEKIEGALTWELPCDGEGSKWGILKSDDKIIHIECNFL